MQDTSERILIAALELMKDKGFKSVTMKDIALASEVSEMTVFRQFNTKKGVLEAAVEKYSYIPSFKEIFDFKVSGDLEKDLQLVAKAYLSLMKKNQPIFLISIQERKTMPELSDIISKNTKQLKELLSNYFSTMQDKQKMIKTDPELQSVIFLTTFYGYFSSTAFWENSILNEFSNSFIETSVRTFCSGIKK